jgi:hypothetical protein
MPENNWWIIVSLGTLVVIAFGEDFFKRCLEKVSVGLASCWDICSALLFSAVLLWVFFVM